MPTWRDAAAKVITKALEGVDRADTRAVRRALRAAYPFGPRRYYPYRAWLLEVRRILGHGLHKRPSGPQMDLFDHG